MPKIPVIEQFSENINWNAFSYVASKLLTTALSFILYKALSTADFSVWANALSIIFLLLLWLDCGFRKSVPRFIPEYSENKQGYFGFIKNIILFRIGTLVCTMPFFYLIVHSWINGIYALSSLSATTDISTLLIIICCIFFVEGIVALLRILFQAHFWSKQFTTVYTSMVTGEMGINFYCIYTMPDNPHLVTIVLITKLISGVGTTVCTSYVFYALTSKKGFSNINPIKNISPNPNLTRKFITHSALMWITNSIKSLSERNFMVPLLTYALGPVSANMYKVANDGASLLYRSVFKTIGSTDTTLLSHVTEGTDQRALRIASFEKLSKTIIFLCTVSLIAGVFLSHCAATYAIKPSLLYIFGLLLISYILEILLSPYERILEVDRLYKYLFYAYIPYIAIMIIIVETQLAYYLGLIGTITLICISRLASSLIMTLYACKNHQNMFKFPFAYAKKMFLVCVFFSALIYLGAPCLTQYLRFIY